ncbi:MAG: class II aldolase/adducin family protein [Verrucomicrobiia bacterium]
MASDIIKALTKLGKAMVEKGLVVGSGGNISGRDGKLVFLSPTGYSLDSIKPKEWSVIDLNHGKQLGGLKPTCEVEMHLRIFKARSDVRFVCHAHPATAVGLISGGMEIMPFTPEFVASVDRIKYVPFITPGGHKLAVAVEKAFAKGVNTVGLRNHGVITVGRSTREALMRMIIIEDQAKIQVAAIAAGKPRPLTAKEQDAVRHMDAEAYRRP